MGSASLLDELLVLLENWGVEVRSERLGGSGGGLCAVRHRRVFFLDIDADEATREARAIAALAELPEAEQTYLPPAVRERVEKLKE